MFCASILSQRKFQHFEQVRAQSQLSDQGEHRRGNAADAASRRLQRRTLHNVHCSCDCRAGAAFADGAPSIPGLDGATDDGTRSNSFLTYPTSASVDMATTAGIAADLHVVLQNNEAQRCGGARTNRDGDALPAVPRLVRSRLREQQEPHRAIASVQKQTRISLLCIS